MRCCAKGRHLGVYDRKVRMCTACLGSSATQAGEAALPSGGGSQAARHSTQAPCAGLAIMCSRLMGTQRLMQQSLTGSWALCPLFRAGTICFCSVRLHAVEPMQSLMQQAMLPGSHTVLQCGASRRQCSNLIVEPTCRLLNLSTTPRCMELVIQTCSSTASSAACRTNWWRY